MKFLIIVLAAIIAMSAADQETFKIPSEIVEKIKKHAMPCADENKLDQSVYLKLADGSLPDDEPHRKFVYCFTKSAGYVSEDGHMISEKLAQILKGHPLQEQFRQALDQCNQLSKDSPLTTVIAMHKCFAERPPVRLLF